MILAVVLVSKATKKNCETEILGSNIASSIIFIVYWMGFSSLSLPEPECNVGNAAASNSQTQTHPTSSIVFETESNEYMTSGRIPMIIAGMNSRIVLKV
jgi:hypothetical protein